MRRRPRRGPAERDTTSGPPDEPGFATTLLTPAPTGPGATECELLLSATAIIQRQDVPMRPAMVAPARMSVLQSQSADGAEMHWGALLWPPAGETTDPVNALAAVRTGPLCAGQGMARMLVDGLSETSQHGAWDLPPGAKDIVVGGGELPGTGAILVP